MDDIILLFGSALVNYIERSSLLLLNSAIITLLSEHR